MSEPRPAFPNPQPFDWAALSGPGGFRADARFCDAPAPPPPPDPAPPPPEPVDPIGLAWQEGFNAGLAEAHEEAAALAAKAEAARDKLALSFARLDAALEEELRQRLRETVAALCENAIAPLALDVDALARRVEKAVSMLSRADDDRVIRLNPEDIALVSDRLAADWNVLPDPALPRGSLRVETATGGVEDGPEQWRRAIAEALHQC